jgi:hypothetical protein
MRVSDQGYFAFVALLSGIHVCLLGILATWKFYFSRVMIASSQGYLAFVDWLFGIFKVWKCDSSSVLKPSAQGYVTTVGPYWTLWCPEYASPVELWDPEFKPSSGKLYSILANWKCDYSSVMGPSPQRYLASTKTQFGLLMSWQWDYSRVVRLLVEEYMVPVEQLFVILATWKSDSCVSLDSALQGK